MIIDKTYNTLITFAQSGIPLYIVPGNHERSQLPESLLLQHPNIHIFSQPKTYTLSGKDPVISISGFPCERRNVKGRFSDLLLKAGWYDNNSEIKILCMHQAIEGACVGPSDYIFKSGEDIIPLTNLPTNATSILVGHIHRNQELTLQNRKRRNPVPVLFSGSIERTSFAEKNEIKGFYHLCFTNRGEGPWRLSEKKFIHLYTRPMIDIQLYHGMTTYQIKQTILNIIQYKRDAIIRIRYRNNTNLKLKSELTSPWLREILPETVNFVLSKDF